MKKHEVIHTVLFRDKSGSREHVVLGRLYRMQLDRGEAQVSMPHRALASQSKRQRSCAAARWRCAEHRFGRARGYKMPGCCCGAMQCFQLLLEGGEGGLNGEWCRYSGELLFQSTHCSSAYPDPDILSIIGFASSHSELGARHTKYPQP